MAPLLAVDDELAPLAVVGYVEEHPGVRLVAPVQAAPDPPELRDLLVGDLALLDVAEDAALELYALAVQLVPRRLGALAVHALGVGDEARAQELLGHVAPGGVVHEDGGVVRLVGGLAVGPVLRVRGRVEQLELEAVVGAQH